MRRYLLALTASCLTFVSLTGSAQDRAPRAASSRPAIAIGHEPGTGPAGAPKVPSSIDNRRALLDQYCVTCHNQRSKAGGLALDVANVEQVGADPETWEKVVRKLRAGVMPPAGRPRPDRASYDAFRVSLETDLDAAGGANPNPGRPAVFHRLNRAEYRNAIRDLLALDLDLTSWLPSDASSYGFDNIGDVLGLSPALLERYLSAAQRISRIAIADPTLGPAVETYVVPSDLTQRDRLDGLPFGTRGGALVDHYFPVDAEYVIQIRLGRNFNNNINGLNEPHRLEITIDGERVKVFDIGSKEPTPGRGGRPRPAAGVPDDELRLRLPVKAGLRAVGVAFLKRPLTRFEDIQKPILRDASDFGDTQGQPSLAKIEIDGPYGAASTGNTSSRQRIFTCRPAARAADEGCAKTIIASLARRAFRRPVTDADLQLLLRQYNEGRSERAFEKGIEDALSIILVSPSFLFRIEQDPARGVPAGATYRINDLELASRLSFFLWSSIPDDELLDLAERGKLKDAAVLERQVRRMLADARSEALIRNFTGQWLHLRNVPEMKPDRGVFPDFDENLRRAFLKETELFIDSVLREDHNVVDLLSADYTFVNERLARHYGIPNVYGDHFRRVTLTDPARGGLLGQGSILTVRSYPNRTSPVMRGVWILENIIGLKPPAPPPNVPELKDTSNDGKVLSMRERMVQHRSNPVCASCHAMMDPLGLPLETFDAVGQWRTMSEANTPIDASGALPDGTRFDGPAGLKKALLSRSDAFVNTFTEKLLTYALGRGMEYYDGPAVRRIVRDAAAQDYRFSSFVLGIVKSLPFQMRRTLDRPVTTAAQR